MKHPSHRLARLWLHTLLTAFLLIVSAAAGFGEEITPIEVEVDEETEAQFTLAVEEAWLVEEEEGEALKLTYKVTNESGETLSVQGIALGIYDEGGELKRTIELAASTDLKDGSEGTFQQTFNPSSLGTVKSGDTLRVRATTSRGRDCYNQLTGGCFGADFLCEQKCNGEPWGTNRGVAQFFCGNCYRQWDAERQCYVESCTFICVCNETFWPDQMPGYDPWGDPLDGPYF